MTFSKTDTLSKNCIDYTDKEWSELSEELESSLNGVIEKFENHYQIQPMLNLHGTFNSEIIVDFFNREKMSFDKPLSKSRERLKEYTEHIKGTR